MGNILTTSTITRLSAKQQQIVIREKYWLIYNFLTGLVKILQVNLVVGVWIPRIFRLAIILPENIEFTCKYVYRQNIYDIRPPH